MQKFSFYDILFVMSGIRDEEYRKEKYSSFIDLLLPEIDSSKLFEKEKVSPEQIKEELESFKKLRFSPTVLGTIDREMKEKVYDSMKGYN